ncbi:MAG: cytochrome c [Deltaproteobacteria bacterium]|nr:cytochrome c [Deltaproteobacteria bacterium]
MFLLAIVLGVGSALSETACDDIVYGERDVAPGEGLPGDDDTAGDDDTGGPIDAPTWASFVEGFMMDYCVRCHGDPPSSSAPFALETYDQVVDHLNRVVARTATENGGMPPTGPFPTQDERDALVAWADAGAPLE